MKRMPCTRLCVFAFVPMPLLYGGVWLLAKYHATVTHISETKRSDTRRREERYYNYYITQAQTLEEMRRFRHDYKNLLSGLKVLIDSGEYERASEYLSGIAAVLTE